MITVYVGQSAIKDMLTLSSILSSTMEWENITKIYLYHMYTNIYITAAITFRQGALPHYHDALRF